MPSELRRRSSSLCVSARALSRPCARGLVALACAALAAIGCGHAPPAPDSPGAADYYRQRLADSPRGSRAVEFRDALEASEFFAARKKGTILGFRTFLSEFPDGPHQREARTLLEALRWNEASAVDTEAALQGFLADEPQGAHAGEAWARSAALQLAAAVQAQSAAALRQWLQANPGAAGRDEARRALDAAEFREAAAAPLPKRRGLLRAYLQGHPEGLQRKEAEELEAASAIEEAVLLGDREELRAWARSGNGEAARRLEELSLDEAEARLDRAGVAELARATDARVAASARQRLGELQKGARSGARWALLVAAAQALYLPASAVASSAAPRGPRERARSLREAALGFDGRELAAILAEFSSTQAWVAEASLESLLLLLEALPPAEAALRASRAAVSLQPLAQDGTHLAALALLLQAAGEGKAALDAARAAAARDPRSLLVQQVALRLELAQGERALALLSARSLVAAARAALEARALPADASPAAGAPVEGEDAPTLWALCAADLGVRAARAALDAPPREGAVGPGAGDPEAESAARAELDAASSSAARDVAQAERAARLEGACARERDFVALEKERRARIRAQAAARLVEAGGLAAEALERARRRDPSPLVRTALPARATVVP